MAGGEAIGAKVAGEREQVGELGPMLHFTQGMGVRPARYSSAKSSITSVLKREAWSKT